MSTIQTSQSTVASAKILVRDLVRRQLDKSFRPLRILGGSREFAARRSCARALNPGAGFPIELLDEVGFMQLEPDRASVDALTEACRQKLRDAEALPQRGNKPFFSQLLGASDYTQESVYLRFALDERMLTTVSRYLRCAPFLNSVELLYSKPLGAGPMASQLWHRDRRDLAIIKVFVYASDVFLANGPLTVLPKKESKAVPEYLTHYLTDQQMDKYSRLDRARPLTGPAGTTWMVDSENCYHLGSRCTEPRLAYVAYYDSGFGYRPRETSWERWVSAGEWTPLQRFALGLP